MSCVTNTMLQPLMAAWKAACGSAGAVTMVVTPGTYYIGPVQFHGPCKASTLTFQLQASQLHILRSLPIAANHELTGRVGMRLHTVLHICIHDGLDRCRGR